MTAVDLLSGEVDDMVEFMGVLFVVHGLDATEALDHTLDAF